MKTGARHRGSNRVTEGSYDFADGNEPESVAFSYQRLISKLLNLRMAVSLAEDEKRSRTSRRMPLERVRLTYTLDPHLWAGLGLLGEN
jgi:hypothetical protein